MVAAKKKAADKAKFFPSIHCAHDVILPLTELKEHPKNPNKHSAAQIELLAQIIAHQGWRAPIVVSNLSGFIVAGHARLAAAKKLGLQSAPVNRQNFATKKDEIAHLVADNRSTSMGRSRNQ
jgi:ParB-like chromosome segregation protein Spo0J